MKKFLEAIDDCNECLKLESTNIKAMLRKAEALNALNRNNEAYEQYSKILKIDPEHTFAAKAVKAIPIR